MEQSLQETAATSSQPKKKRGRPKKSEKLLLLQNEASTAVAKDVPKVRRKKKKGFSKSVSLTGKKKKQQQGTMSSSAKLSQSDDACAGGPLAEKEESTPYVKVGQSVRGVVDGTFDAGYLVTVRVGDSETMFRGVVFGPGLSLPLNRDNDVAPKMKRMNRDDTPEVGASSASPNEGAPVPASSVPLPPHAASIPLASPLPPTVNEPHRVATMAPGPAGMGFHGPAHAIPPSGSAGYSPAATYRSPSYGQSPMQNASGGFYYAQPTHTPSPNNNLSHGGYYPPRGFSYPFQFPRAEYGGPSQFAGPSPSASPAPTSLQGGGFPPHAS